MATFGTTIGSGGFRFYDKGHEVSHNYVEGVYGGNFQGPLLLDTGDAEGSSSNLSGHWRVVNAVVQNNVIVDCPEGIRIGDNYDSAPIGCTITGNVVARVATGQAVTQRVAPVSTTISNNTYYATPGAGGMTQDSFGIWRKSGVGPRLTFLQPGDVGITGDPGDTDGTGALVGGGGGPGPDPDPDPDPPDTDTAAGRYGWGTPLPISDEFDYTGIPDPNKWKLPGADWAGHNGNGTRDPERVEVRDGRLIMSGLANGSTGWMQHKLDQQYGRWEVRCRSRALESSNGNDYHPVLLIWPTSNSRQQDGEYDFLENGAPGEQEAGAFLHYPHPGTSVVQQEHFERPNTDLTQWHNFALEWTPDHLKLFCDGELWGEASGGANSVRRDIQDMPSGHGTIQLDNFDGTDQTPAVFEVEWYRVYTLVPSGPPPGAKTVTPSGIPSGQAFGFPTITGAEPEPPAGSHPTMLGTTDTVLGSTLLGYTFGEAPPNPSGPKSITAAGAIGTGQTFGLPLVEVEDGPQTVRGVAIDSDEEFGRPTVAAGEPPPTAPGGVLVPSIYAVGRDGKLTPLHSWTKLSPSPLRNSMGAFTLEYPAGAPGFSVLDENVSAHPLRALEVRIWLGGSQEGALGGWLTNKEGDDLLPGTTWTFTGHFHEWLLSKAIIGPQERNEANPKGELRFAAATAGLVLSTMMDQAQARGALPLVTRDFSATHDSNGNPWPVTVSSLAFAPKTTILQAAEKLVELGMVEFELTAARVWRAYAAGTRGTDHTTGLTPLTFAHAVNLREHARRESAKDAGTAVLAAGSEGFYSWAESASAVAELGWRAEVGADAGQLESASAVQAAAATYLEAIRHGVAEFVGQVEFATGVPLPIVDWGVGDWAYTWVGNKRRRLRIAQIGIEFTKDEPPRGTVVLNDLITDKVAALYKRLNAITAGDAVVGTSEPTPGGSGEDKIPPSAPTGLTLSSQFSYREAGETVSLATVSAGWEAVLTDAYADEDTARKAIAAPLIADRLRSGQPMHEELWSWDNNPMDVGNYALQLLEEFKRDHRDVDPYSSSAEAWLRAWPTENMGGGPVTGDVSHYRVQYRYLGLQNLTPTPDTGTGEQPPVEAPLPEDVTWFEPAGSPTQSTSLTFGGVEGGRTVGVRVAAVDRSDNQGPWSEVVAVDAAPDDQPPPVPSAPIGAVWFRTADWFWDGKGAAGEDMLAAAPDFASGGSVEIHVAEGIDFIPDRPVGPDGKVDLSQSTTFVAHLYAAGTYNQVNLQVGKTYFARFVAVDRSGNASDPSATSNGVMPQQLVNIDIGPNAVGRLQIIDGEIVRAKIADLAVNSAKVEEIEVGKLTAGTMTAQVTVSGRFSTPMVNGNQLEFDSAGIRLRQGGTVVGRWQVSDASMLVTGTYLSGLSGARINILPDGTLRFYPSAGINYSVMYNLGGDNAPDGPQVVWRGPVDNNGRSGRFNVNITGCGMNFSREDEVPNALRSEIALFDRRTRTTAPLVVFEVDGRLEPPDGSTRRVQFQQTDSTGAVRPFSFLSYGTAPDVDDVPGRGGMFGNGAGWKLEGGVMIVTDDSLSSFGPIHTSDVVEVSSAREKRDIVDARVELDPLRVIRNARSRRFRYKQDRDDAPPRFGPLAEELPKALRRVGPDAKGGGRTVVGVELGSMIGLLWAAEGEQITRVDSLIRAVKSINTRLAAIETALSPQVAPSSIESAEAFGTPTTEIAPEQEPPSA